MKTALVEFMPLTQNLNCSQSLLHLQPRPDHIANICGVKHYLRADLHVLHLTLSVLSSPFQNFRNKMKSIWIKIHSIFLNVQSGFLLNFLFCLSFEKFLLTCLQVDLLNLGCVRSMNELIRGHHHRTLRF